MGLADAATSINPKAFTGAKPHTYQGNLWLLHPAIVKQLLPLPNFVNWNWELNPKGDAWTKVPYQPCHPAKRASTKDKTTWGTHHDAVANVVARKADGIGFCLLETNICAFDIDNCRDLATGKIDPVVTALVNRCGDTYVEKTVSGTGLRVIGLGGTKYVNRKLKIDGSKVSIEIYRNCARYITISGMVLDGVEPGMPDLGNIDALITSVVNELDNQTKAKANETTPRNNHKADAFAEASLPPDLASLIRDGVPMTEDRSAAFYHAVKWLKDRGWSLDDIIDLLARHPNGIASKYGSRFTDETARAFGKPDKSKSGATNNGRCGVAIDDFYAYMPGHSYIFVPTREMWPASSVNSRLPAVAVLKEDGTPAVDANGKPKLVRPSVWLDKQRPVEQMTWVPGEPLTIDGKLIAEGGWVERPDVTTFNLYLPPDVRQGNSTSADRWVELVERVYPDDAEHIITFCAHRIQYPAVKINHGLILGGAPGIGKDTILEPLKLGVGQWNFKEVSPQDIMSNYNDYLQCVVLRISEARDLGEVNRYAFYEHMKTILATPPDVIRVNAKYMPQHYVVNVAGVIYTTNHRFDGVFLPADDRRTHVAWSEITSAEFVGDFWKSFWGWYAAGGLADTVAYLAEYDLSKFDPKAPPKKTAAFWQIVGVGAAPEEAELKDILDKLGAEEKALDADGKPCGPVVTTLAVVVGKADANLSEWLTDRKNRRVIPHRFERCSYAPVRNEDAKDGLWVIKSKRQAVYGRLDVPLRELIEAARRLA